MAGKMERKAAQLLKVIVLSMTLKDKAFRVRGFWSLRVLGTDATTCHQQRISENLSDPGYPGSVCERDRAD